ncbi:VLF-1 [Crangon crangon nudivirus]|uniref:VLF-1 n=1 Tax=Crangon crangon nudivirus TaxID=2880838 RepID=A0AAE9BZ35_9VIRU|nr:VLF-1 [Crangon crangon nudivirus]UBZ25572.1 VLF-1 [Crangon crangon nudivirus]
MSDPNASRLPKLNRQELSHFNLLQHNGIQADNLSDTNIKAALDSLNTKKQTPLSNNYKISILRTICKLNPYITVTAKELKIVPYRSKSSGTPITANQKLNVIRYAYQFKLDTISILKTSAAVDTIIAILLITSTTIGHTDLFAIRHIDFQSLIVNKFLAINRHRIDLNETLFAIAKPLIKALLHYRKSRFTQLMYTEKARFKNSLISVTPSVINRNIREIFISVNPGGVEINHIGLQYLRYPYPDVILAYIKS